MQANKMPETLQKGPVLRFFFFLLWLAKWTFKIGLGGLAGVAFTHYSLTVLSCLVVIGLNAVLRFGIYLKNWSDNCESSAVLWKRFANIQD